MSAENSPAAWFCVLEVARQRGDVAKIREAESQLRRLGVRVQFDEDNAGRQPPRQEATA